MQIVMDAQLDRRKRERLRRLIYFNICFDHGPSRVVSDVSRDDTFATVEKSGAVSALRGCFEGCSPFISDLRCSSICSKTPRRVSSKMRVAICAVKVGGTNHR